MQKPKKSIETGSKQKSGPVPVKRKIVSGLAKVKADFSIFYLKHVGLPKWVRSFSFIFVYPFLLLFIVNCLKKIFDIIQKDLIGRRIRVWWPEDKA